ncbi:sortase [Candidatus Woesebacteria bacterium]|nr:sortase [Candidatus Woesebacteria bacterium]
MSKTNHKKHKKNYTKNAPLLLIVVGAFLMSVSGLHWYFKYQSLSLDADLLSQHSQENQTATGFIPEHIYIQWFVDTPISEQVLIDTNWTISETDASYLRQSAQPGQPGNIIIYGHNTREILGNIRALKGTEIITITTKNGEKHRYKVSLITEVDPDQTEYLLPTNEETLTLYTCSGFLDKKRFIVQAKPILDEPAQQ